MKLLLSLSLIPEQLGADQFCGAGEAIFHAAVI